MPLPQALARFNRLVTNTVTRPLAARLPGFGVIVHTGRVSGKEYRTPVNCWLDEATAIVALTYGPGTDWLMNLQDGDGGAMVVKGETHRVGRPALIGEEGMGRMPAMVRPMLRLIDVDEFAVLPLLKSGRPT